MSEKVLKAINFAIESYNYETAEFLCERIPDSKIILQRIYYLQGKHKKAIKLLEFKYESIVLYARSCLKLSMFKECEEVVHKGLLLELLDLQKSCLFNILGILYKNTNPKNAIFYLLQAVEFNPLDYHSYTLLCELLHPIKPSEYLKSSLIYKAYPTVVCF